MSKNVGADEAILKHVGESLTKVRFVTVEPAKTTSCDVFLSHRAQ